MKRNEQMCKNRTKTKMSGHKRTEYDMRPQQRKEEEEEKRSRALKTESDILGQQQLL